ncbi:MAG: MATE family efflux transporter [Ruminiclostridium sp.]|nr:MATE family efflux transporter [Ruminiclostridium sp.]
MLVQAMYNIVDSVFVSRISEDALTAVTIVFPLQNLMISVGAGLGVGVNALLSRSLGEKRFERASKAANTALLFSFFSFILFLIIGLTLITPFVSSQSDDQLTRDYAIQYGQIVCCFSFGLFFQLMLERLLQATGLTLFSMCSQITGAVVNIILDPIMIFGLLGCPQFGIAGAAYATVTGQCIAAIVGLILNLKKNKEIVFSFSSIIKPEGDVSKEIIAVGLPSILMMSIGSVMTYSMNRILKGFSDTATAVFGCYFKLQSFFFMPVFGLNNGTIPILAYNLGAKRKDRLDETLSFMVKLAVSIMFVGTLVFELVPELLLSLFEASDNMLLIGVPALRIIAVHFCFAAVSIALGSVFQAYSRSIYSLIISLCRQIVVLIPAAYLLSLSGNVDMVWWSLPVSEVVSLMLTIIFFRRVTRITYAKFATE